jgi:hypothetical protein
MPYWINLYATIYISWKETYATSIDFHTIAATKNTHNKCETNPERETFRHSNKI